jgi:hypothetical protein
MNELSQYLVNQILLEDTELHNFVVVYSGRFQPFHKGHYATYQNLCKKFGKDKVFIGTSNKTDNRQSPFNFKEKKIIMTKMFGIPSNKIVEIKNPYAPTEILKNFDETTTGYISVVGEKDEMRLGGKYFEKYKGKIEQGYKEKGYVYVSPSQSNPISGTNVRNWLSKGDEEQQRAGFLKAYPKFDEKIFKLITLKLKTMSEGMPGGTGIGISLPNGTINGAPKPEDVKKMRKKLDDEDDINEVLNEVKWEGDTFSRCMQGQLPLSLNIVKQLVDPIKTTSLHVTTIENLPKVAALEGTKKSISTFNKIDKYSKIVQNGKGVDTDGGVFVLLSGVVLAQSIMDLWTAPDKQGRRWVNPGTIIADLGRERDVVFNFAPELKPFKKRWLEDPLNEFTPAEKNEFIRMYYDAAQKFMLSKKKEFQDKYLNSNQLYYESDWNEVVLTQIKIEKILAIPSNWSDDETENQKTLEKLKQKYPKVEVGTNTNDIQNFIKKNGGSIRESVSEDITLDVNIGDTILMGKFKNKKTVVKTIGKDEHGMPTINGKKVATFRIIPKQNIFKEAATVSGGDDSQPDGGYLPKGKARVLGGDDGVNSSDDWFVRGGYTQTDFPKADAIYASDDENQITFKIKSKNNARSLNKPTTYPLGFDDIDVTQNIEKIEKVEKRLKKKVKQKDSISELISDYSDLLDSLFESDGEDDKYVHVGYGKYKEKSKKDVEGAPLFKKDDSGKYTPIGGDEKGGEAKPNGQAIQGADMFKHDKSVKQPKEEPKSQPTNTSADTIEVANKLKNRKTKNGEELDIDVTPNGSLIIGVEHGKRKKSNKQTIEQIKTLPKDTKVMFVGEGGMSKDKDGNIEFGGEQNEIRNAVKGHFDNAEESSWDENADVLDDTSPVFDEVAKVLGGSKSKAKAALWSNMYGQDGPDENMLPEDYLDDEGKEWLIDQAKKGGSSEFDGEVDWNNLTDAQQKDLYELNYRDDDGYGETEISKAQEEYNGFRQRELDRKIKEAEDAGYTVIAPVGNSHVDMRRQRNKKKDTQDTPKTDKNIPNSLSPKVDINKNTPMAFQKIKDGVQNWSLDEKQFFIQKVHKGESPERRSFGEAVKDKAKGALEAIKHGAKHEVHLFKEAGSGVKNFFSGGKVSDSEKKALISVAKKVALAAAFGAAGGGLTHGAAAFGKHLMVEFIPHVVVETIAIGAGKAALFAGEEDPDADMLKFIAIISKKLESAKIPNEIMASAIESFNSNKDEKGDIKENYYYDGTVNNYADWARTHPRKYDNKKANFKVKDSGQPDFEDDLEEIAVQVDKIPGGLSTDKTLNDFATKYNTTIDVIKQKIKDGAKVEMEHTSDIRFATEIAKDHIWEDLNYYTKLKKVEESVITEVKKESVVNYYKAICKDLNIKPITIKFGSVGRAGAATTFDTKTFIPEYITFDLSKVTDIERAILHEITHQILLVKQQNPFHNCNKSVGFKKVENKLIDRYFYSSQSAVLREKVKVEMAKTDMDSVEKYADSQMSPTDVDLGRETDHFFQRLNDPRNGKEISPAELTGLFKRLARNKKKFLEFLKQYKEFVVKDRVSNINIAFIKVADRLIAKTVMRKADFKSSTPVFTTEGDTYNRKKTKGRIIGEFIKFAKDRLGLIGLPFNIKLVKDSEFATTFKSHGGFDEVNNDIFIYVTNRSTPDILRTLAHELVHIKQRQDGYISGAEDGATGSDVENEANAIAGILLRDFGKLNGYIYESVERLLTEGGAYGHMNHPFDTEINLTFGQLKDIVNRALDGNLEFAREKTDGQALAISWIDGRLVAARNKSHLKNKGAGALDINGVADKFAGRGELTDAYNFAMKDLSNAIKSLSQAQKDKVFKNGSCFMNIEVIYPTSVNVIPYGQPLLVFHGTMEYDENGDAIGESAEAGRILGGMLKQVNADVQSKYTLQGPPVLKLPKSQDLSSKKGKYLAMISKLQKEFGLGDTAGVADYHQAWWENFVDKKSPTTLDNATKMGLVKRWAFGEKGFRIDKNSIKDEKTLAWATKIDKEDHKGISKDNLMKFEDIFLGVGADVLEFTASVLTVNPDSALRDMKKRLEQTIKDVQASGDPKKIDKLKLELKRLNAIGGAKRIVPIEGIVFVYNGQTFKLTGAFASLNQLLGIFYA